MELGRMSRSQEKLQGLRPNIGLFFPLYKSDADHAFSRGKKVAGQTVPGIGCRWGSQCLALQSALLGSTLMNDKERRCAPLQNGPEKPLWQPLSLPTRQLVKSQTSHLGSGVGKYCCTMHNTSRKQAAASLFQSAAGSAAKFVKFGYTVQVVSVRHAERRPTSCYEGTSIPRPQLCVPAPTISQLLISAQPVFN